MLAPAPSFTARATGSVGGAARRGAVPGLSCRPQDRASRQPARTLRKAGMPMGTTLSSMPSRDAGRKVSTKGREAASGPATSRFRWALVTCRKEGDRRAPTPCMYAASPSSCHVTCPLLPECTGMMHSGMHEGMGCQSPPTEETQRKQPSRDCAALLISAPRGHVCLGAWLLMTPQERCTRSCALGCSARTRAP